MLNLLRFTSLFSPDWRISRFEQSKGDADLVIYNLEARLAGKLYHVRDGLKRSD